MYFWGILRDADDMRYQPPSDAKSFTIQCGYNSLHCDPVQVTASENGIFSGYVDLNDDAPTWDHHLLAVTAEDVRGYLITPATFVRNHCVGGNYERVDCYVEYASGMTFNVADVYSYDYQVNATQQPTVLVEGDTYSVTIRAQDQAGNALQDFGGRGFVWMNPGTFAYQDYTFDYPYRRDFYDRDTYPMPQDVYDVYSIPPEGVVFVPSEGDGEVILYHDTDIPSLPVPVRIIFSATARNDSIYGRQSLEFILHPAAVYAGQRNIAPLYDAGETATFEFIAVTPDEHPVAGQAIDVTVERIAWSHGSYDPEGVRWTKKFILADHAQLITQADGTATMPFSTRQGGEYRVHASVTDDRENTHNSYSFFYVNGEGGVFKGGKDARTFDIIPDKTDAYQPGDTARLLIPAPINGTMLVTVERGSVMMTDIISLTETQGSLIYDLNIETDYAPGVFVTATLVGTDASGIPAYSHAEVELPVDISQRQLNVAIDTPPQALTDEQVQVDVRVTDIQGNPVANADVLVSVVDEAVLVDYPVYNLTLEEGFYGLVPWFNFVQSRHAIRSDHMLDGLTAGLTDDFRFQGRAFLDDTGVYYGLSSEMESRMTYDTTPLWATGLVTDADGTVSTTVTLPDHPGQWRIEARAITPDTRVGQTDTILTSTHNYLSAPPLPDSLVMDDRFEITTDLQNITDTAQTFTVRLESEGLTLLSPVQQVMTVQPQAQQTITWQVSVQNVDAVTFSIHAESAALETDWQLAQPIPVYRYQTRETVIQPGSLAAGERLTETITVPDNAIAATLTPVMAASLREMVLLLPDDPSSDETESTDSTLARLMINLTYLQAHDIFPELDDARLRTAIERDMQQLLDGQLAEGHWKWDVYADEEYTPTTLTALIIQTLFQAQQQGFNIPELTAGFARGCALLDHWGWYPAVKDFHSTQPYFSTSCDTDSADIDTRLAAIIAEETDADTIKRRVDKVLAQMVYHDEITAMDSTDELLQSITFTGHGFVWALSDEELEAFLEDSPLTLAWMAQILLHFDPNHEHLPSIIDALMHQRTNAGWQSPMVTAYALRTLVAYMTVHGDLPAVDYQLFIDGQRLTDAPVPLIPGVDTEVILERDSGAGELYYTADLTLQLPAGEIAAQQQGVQIIRDYLNAEGDPITSAQPGDLVYIRLTFVIEQPVFRFLAEDFAPAGLQVSSPDIRVLSPEEGIRWLHPYPDTFDKFYESHRTIFYAYSLQPGVYVTTYAARATVAGSFHALPVQAYALSDIAISGQSPSANFCVGYC